MKEKLCVMNDKNGLFKKYEDVLKFIELRKKDMDSGLNIEDFWKKTPIRISIIKNI